MGTAGDVNIWKPRVRKHLQLCEPGRVRGTQGMATSSPQVPSPLRPKLGHSKTFPCSPKCAVYLCISNNNSSTVPQGFLVQAGTRHGMLSFAPNTTWRCDSRVKTMFFKVKPPFLVQTLYICSIIKVKH